jgi:DNA segregation ATPase FtsK/SpoIIIE, S-DNA-T family
LNCSRLRSWRGNHLQPRAPGRLADIVGIALASLALLLFVALVSYDPHDVSATTTTPNPIVHNWIGLAGAWTGWLTFFLFGAAAYLVPILIGCFGLSYLFQSMDYFHRHWIWSGLLLLCCTGWLDIYQHTQLLATFTANVKAPSAGGYVGLMLNRLVFGHFGDLGATLIYLTVYLISLFYLTNFRLGQWLRDLWQHRLVTANGLLNAQERLLKKRAREIERKPANSRTKPPAPASAPTRPTESKEELMANARLMQSTLAQFGIEVALGDITKGPTITRYELHPAPGVKLERITGLTNNIAAALKAERIHILAPVPGKSSVGVEVPNLVKTKVIMRDLLESEEWRNTKARVPLALGKDVYGHPIVADLAEMPHLLIAGSTGSGKSVCINSIISSLLYRFSPDQLRFVMIDPKVVELQLYNHLPHLVVPVVNDPKKVILALRWVVSEMEKRYQIFARVGVRNIRSFNDRPKTNPPPKEPELPLTAKKEKSRPAPTASPSRSTRKSSSRATTTSSSPNGSATSSSSSTNSPTSCSSPPPTSRWPSPASPRWPAPPASMSSSPPSAPASMSSPASSRPISPPASPSRSPPRRFPHHPRCHGRRQTARQRRHALPAARLRQTHPRPGRADHRPGNPDIVDFIARQGKPSYEMEIHQQLSRPGRSLDDESGIDEDEDLIQQCIEVIRSEQKASVSLLQRRLAPRLHPRRPHHGRTRKPRHRRPQQRRRTARHPHRPRRRDRAAAHPYQIRKRRWMRLRCSAAYHGAGLDCATPSPPPEPSRTRCYTSSDNACRSPQ